MSSMKKSWGRELIYVVSGLCPELPCWDSVCWIKWRDKTESRMVRRETMRTHLQYGWDRGSLKPNGSKVNTPFNNKQSIEILYKRWMASQWTPEKLPDIVSHVGNETETSLMCGCAHSVQQSREGPPESSARTTVTEVSSLPGGDKPCCHVRKRNFSENWTHTPGWLSSSIPQVLDKKHMSLCSCPQNRARVPRVHTF